MDYKRKYQCKYCEFRGTRDQLVNHVEKKHEDHITPDYPAARIVYNHLNHVENGKCIICGKPTKWNDKTWKYSRHCGSKECKDKIRDTYRTNAVKATGKYNFASDPKHLEKMLAARKISGIYTCSNGSKKTYTGSYERKAIEFLDKVMQVDPSDIMMPGPIFQYEYNGEIHNWITDIFYLPYNLVIEVKDGGDNPNNRSMVEYREKQLAKEKAIIQSGAYNYLRLTNNNFSQLFDMFATLRISMINDTEEARKAIIKINETVDIDDKHIKHDWALIAVCFEENVVDSIAITDMSSAKCIVPVDGILFEVDKSELPEYSKTYLINEMTDDQVNRIRSLYDEEVSVDPFKLFEIVCDKEFIGYPQLLIESNLTHIDLDDTTFSRLTANALDHKNSVYCLESSFIENLDDVTVGKLTDANIKLMNSPKGYYLETIGIEPALATDYTNSLYDTIQKIDNFALLVSKYGR